MRFKNRLTGAVVAASLLVSVGGVGAANAATSTGDTATVSEAVSARDDGRAIAEAILFGSGVHADAVASIPALALSQEVAEGNESAEAQDAITTVLDKIEAGDPGIYDAVHTGLRSGDPYAVEASLIRLSDSARTAITEYSESTVGGQGRADVTPNAVVAVVVAVIHVLAVVTAANAALFVNAVAGANVIWAENWGPSSAVGERPAELIGDLADAFAE